MRLTMIAGAAAGALLLGGPALAEGAMQSETSRTQSGEQSAMSERCDRLAERFREAEVQRGAEADVLEAEVRHEKGVRACNGGNYTEGIGLIQQALREIGAPADVTAN